MTGVQTCALPICFPVTIRSVDHFKKHKCLLDQPEIRENSEKAGVILNHMMEHENMYKELITNDPLFLQMSGQKLVEMPPPPMGAPQEVAPPQEGMPGMPGMPNNPITGEDFDPVTGGLDGAQ